VEDAAQLFVNPSSYTDETTLEAALALLREKAPVVRVEHPSYRTFWAVTKYADIIEVLRNHELWLNERARSCKRSNSTTLWTPCASPASDYATWSTSTAHTTELFARSAPSGFGPR
jgi:cytochrome P450